MRIFSRWSGFAVQVVAAALLCGGACQRASAQLPSDLAAVAVPPTTTLNPELVAQLVTPVIKNRQNGAGIRIKTGVMLTNQGGAAAKNVTVAAYVSDDGTLSADDTSLGSIQLSAYKNKGNLKPAASFTLPLSYRIPAAFVDGLRGKYLIFVPSADNFTADPTSGVAVFGPISLP